MASPAPLLDVLKKKMKETKDEMEKYKDEADELQKKLQLEVLRREEAEAEVANISRRVQLVEQSFERSEERFSLVAAQLEQAISGVDEAERQRKAFENRCNMGDDRLAALEDQLAQAKLITEDSDKKYEEAARKLIMKERDLTRAEERAEAAESKINKLEEELRTLGNNVKSHEASEEKISQMEESYASQLKSVSGALQVAVARAEAMERSAQKLQKEVDGLEDELVSEREKYKVIAKQMDQTYAELAGF